MANLISGRHQLSELSFSLIDGRSKLPELRFNRPEIAVSTTEQNQATGAE
jgi:hypothetical protein